MKFEESYTEIKKACLGKENISFYIDKSNTSYANSGYTNLDVAVPKSWEAYPTPTFSGLSPEDIKTILVRFSSQTDPRSALTRLVLDVHQLGGRAFFKEKTEELVDFKMEFV